MIDYFRGEGFARYDDIVYQLAFWNAVDLRFRHVDNPKIRLRIAGIIIGIVSEEYLRAMSTIKTRIICILFYVHRIGKQPRM